MVSTIATEHKYRASTEQHSAHCALLTKEFMKVNWDKQVPICCTEINTRHFSKAPHHQQEISNRSKKLESSNGPETLICTYPHCS